MVKVYGREEDRRLVNEQIDKETHALRVFGR